ncbi:hypothetical protein PQG02_24715 [Nostoc sp. UHCC 0926]|nr:hypothetical protein [Nostoc sp. UHCC 0926]WDD35819.1 hypothetical protein PQG02_24715 [Nostoc sp. UHCC 0926]
MNNGNYRTTQRFSRHAQVLECDIISTQCAKVRSRLAKLIKPDTDSVRFYFLCGCCQRKIEHIGKEQPRDETIFFAESPSG